MSHSKTFKQPTFGKAYNHPDGDLVISSNDGMLFRVHSAILRAQSPYLDDQLKRPQSSFYAKAAFQISGDQHAAVLFLDLVHGIISLDADYSNENYAVVLGICNEFGCLVLQDRLLNQLHNMNDGVSMWDIFTLASHLKLLPMAKVAISNLWRDEKWQNGCMKMTVAAAEKVDFGYLMGYMNSIRWVKKLDKEEDPAYCARVASDFEPLVDKISLPEDLSISSLHL